MTRGLVVTADDLGLTAGVNAAIERGSQAGIVTATSLLAVGRFFDDAVALLHRNPSLDAGAHLALVGEDPPLLPPDAIGSLVDDNGRFPLSYVSVVARGATGRLRTAHIRAELTAQLEKILDAGVPVSHLDAHQHTHLWPQVGAVVVDLAERYRIPFVRVPGATRAHPVTVGVNALAALLRRRVANANLQTTSAYRGLDEAGRMDANRMVATARQISGQPLAGTHLVEINCHPGSSADPDAGRFAWDFWWDAEAAMVTSPVVSAELPALGFRLTNFRDLAA